MINIIVAFNNIGGIGYKGQIPWNCSEDLKLFKTTTKDSVLIVGRKTFETLPNLKDRIVLVVSKTMKNYHASVYDAIIYAKKTYPTKKIFICGGSEIYKYVLENMRDITDKLFISRINNDMDCDRYINIDFSDWERVEEKKYTEFIFETWIPKVFQEKQYLDLLKDVLTNGIQRKTRNGFTKSLFGRVLNFDLRKGFPLFTTKKMFFRGIFEELLFFIKGETDSKKLESKGVNIWKGNTNRNFLNSVGFNDRREGLMGPMYGFQWRHFGSKYCENTGNPVSNGMDQLKYVIDTIKNDPTSRRILMTDFNPLQASEGVLYPCHSLILQFYVINGYLDMTCYNRSQDLFLGTPFNVASSALLLCLIAKLTHLTPRFLYMSLGDVHIYSEHLECSQLQIDRTPFDFPTLNIRKNLYSISDIENLEYTDIILEGYKCHEQIKAIMIS